MQMAETSAWRESLPPDLQGDGLARGGCGSQAEDHAEGGSGVGGYVVERCIPIMGKIRR